MSSNDNWIRITSSEGNKILINMDHVLTVCTNGSGASLYLAQAATDNSYIVTTEESLNTIWTLIDT